MEDYKKRIALIRQKLDIEKLSRQIKEIETASGSPNFWQDQQKAASEMKKMAGLQKEITEVEELDQLLVAGEMAKLEKKLAQVELKTFLSGKYDASPAIVSVHSGQGGTEAMDWVAMLKRMYWRFFEKKGWQAFLIDESPGEEAGIKSSVFKVDEPYAYGYLKYEAGTHRLVRQSPFNADNLRQTSFALVEVLPQISSAEGIEINENDLEIQFYHASSHGGQNVQKVSTAVRIKHKPTGIITSSQSQRYQEQNRKIALEILQAKLWSLQQAQAKKEEQKLKAGRTKASWGTQIRSYVLHPYKMVKDLRTDYQTGNPDSILDGELDDLIETEIKNLS